MFNTKQFNLNQFNEGIVGITGVIAGDITYGGYILHKTNNISLSYADIHNSGSVEDNTYNRPDIDGLGLNSYFLRAKTITLEGILKGNSKEDLENRMKIMMGELAKPNKNLQVISGGSFYRAAAYCKNLSSIFRRREHYHNTFVPFDIVFQINEPFWEGVQLQAITYNITDTLLEEIINTGTAMSEPNITIAFNSATSVSEVQLDFGERNLIISDTIAANDILSINSDDKTVKLNGTEIDYTGQLPLLEVGSNPFTITIDGTFDCDVSINYRNRFI